MSKTTEPRGLNKEELLTVLNTAFTDARHELHRCQYPLGQHKKRMNLLNQVENQIKALIQESASKDWDNARDKY